MNALLDDNEKVILKTAVEQNDNKGDDICDSFLQGFHHIFDGEIPEYYQKKIRDIPEEQLQIKKIKSKKRLTTDKSTDKSIDKLIDTK